MIAFRREEREKVLRSEVHFDAGDLAVADHERVRMGNHAAAQFDRCSCPRVEPDGVRGGTKMPIRRTSARIEVRDAGMTEKTKLKPALFIE